MRSVTKDNQRSQLSQALMLEFHRLLFTAHSMMGDYSSVLGLRGKDGDAVLLIWQAELNGAPLSPSELANKLHVTRAAVSYQIDRLEELGHVRREPSDTDRRRTVLRISESGSHVGENFSAPIAAGIDGIFAERSDGELATFTAMLGDLNSALPAAHGSTDPARTDSSSMNSHGKE